jgi:hypothetical protein
LRRVTEAELAYDLVGEILVYAMRVCTATLTLPLEPKDILYTH